MPERDDLIDRVMGAPLSAGPYGAAVDELARRIEALIPANPRILEMTSIWDLFGIPGFHCDDLGPSLVQALGALAVAKERYREGAGRA